MARTLRVVPAYGRDYKGLDAARADWDANKDFEIRNSFDPDDGRKVNKQDFPHGEVLLRYDSLRKQGVLQKSSAVKAVQIPSGILAVQGVL